MPSVFDDDSVLATANILGTPAMAAMLLEAPFQAVVVARGFS